MQHLQDMEEMGVFTISFVLIHSLCYAKSMTNDMSLAETVNPIGKLTQENHVQSPRVSPSEVITREAILRESVQNSPWVLPLVEKLAEYSEWKFNHSMNVAVLSYDIATKIYGYSHQEALTIVRAGIVHDLGYMNVPEEIVNKQGPLAPDEYEAQKSHVEDSMQMIMPFDPEVAYIVVGHHQMQINGYPPIGLYKVPDDIRKKQEVLALADQTEALMAKRPYKPGFDAEKTLYFLTHDKPGNSTNFFDPLKARAAAMIGSDFFSLAA